MVQGQPRQIILETPPHLQNNQRKMDWRHGSSSRALLCKHEALSSNPNSTKKEKVKNLSLLLGMELQQRAVFH
jgi:hypothetical protein